MNEQSVFWVAIDGDLPYVVTCVVNSEFAVASRDMYLMLFFDRYHLRETRFSEIEVKQALSNIRGKTEKKQKRKRYEV